MNLGFINFGLTQPRLTSNVAQPGLALPHAGRPAPPRAAPPRSSCPAAQGSAAMQGQGRAASRLDTVLRHLRPGRPVSFPAARPGEPGLQPAALLPARALGLLRLRLCSAHPLCTGWRTLEQKAGSFTSAAASPCPCRSTKCNAAA